LKELALSRIAMTPVPNPLFKLLFVIFSEHPVELACHPISRKQKSQFAPAMHITHLIFLSLLVDVQSASSMIDLQIQWLFAPADTVGIYGEVTTGFPKMVLSEGFHR
jgi:hypothetical protein